jgi:neogenin
MPRFSSQPAAASIRLGDSQVLACDVNPDLVPLARWEREREPLELSSRLVQLPNGALVVSNASEADAGLYRCMVENAGPAKTSEEAQLTILPGNTIDTI